VSINPKLLNPGEQVIFSTRTHVKALIMPVIVLLLSAGVAGYLSSLPDDNKNIWLPVIWVIAGIVVVRFGVWPFLNWFATTYTFTNRRLTTHTGVISRSGHDIQVSRISDVSYEKGLTDRILGCGTLIISDASELGIRLTDVPKVEERQKVIAELLFHGSKTDDGT